jgi:predicted SprT family Zn-dependent metalloprotease
MAKIKVTYRKLGKEQVIGLAYLDHNEIELDPRLKGKRHFEILIHEIMHIQNPAWEEAEVIRKSRQMCNLLWREQYRRCDNTSKSDL